MGTKIKLFLADIIFWLHFVIVTIWLGTFFIPSSFLPEKIVFQFYLTLIVVGHQIVWGLLILPWTKKFRMVCILTTIMQALRNQKISDPKNYDQAWLKELVGKNGIRFPHWFSATVTFFVLALATYQFIFFR